MKETNSVILNKCHQEISNCPLQHDIAAALCKVFLSLLFHLAQKQLSAEEREETWKTTCSEKNTLECSDGVGGKTHRGEWAAHSTGGKKTPVLLEVLHRKQ